MEVWENEKCCGSTSGQAGFTNSFLEFLQTFLSVSTTQKQLDENAFMTIIFKKQPKEITSHATNF